MVYKDGTTTDTITKNGANQLILNLLETFSAANVTVTLTVSDKASLSKDGTVLPLTNNSINQTLDVDKNVDYVVTAEDGPVAKYTVVIQKQTPTSKAITLFNFTPDDNPLATTGGRHRRDC